MRNIRKHHEPRCLAQHRCQAHADYDNFNGKQELRDSLLSEQGGICAYCMQRIRSAVGGMKIEHWRCQDRYPREQLAYGNLLGVCLGGERCPRTYQHCDTYKGNADLRKNPANPAHNIEVMIRYRGDGIICSEDKVLEKELNEVLNLNHPRLVSNRKAVLDSFTQSLSNLGRLSANSIRRMIDEWAQPERGDLHPFCMVVVYWLRKRLARAG